MNRICVVLAAMIVFVSVLFPCCAATPEILIVEFYATPSPVMQGEGATLHWKVSGATELSIDNGVGLVPLSGLWEIKPAQKTTYTLTARNSGKSAQKSLVLEVNSQPSVTVQVPQIPVLPARETSLLLSSIGKEAIVEGNVTYISSWLPSRYRGTSSTFPWTFMFFMKDVLEGSANNPGTGEYCPECWRDYTSYFRVIIRPEYLSAVLPSLSKIYGGNFYVNTQGLLIGATTEGEMFFIPSASWQAGFIINDPVSIRVQGVIENYLSAPAIYLSSPAQLSATGR